ncbi:hypothetical protein F4553_000377 [Allocatelliglobosispora scoriae]|uniref:Uncharacterized protein n=1 Tax=Allocatelliglobosispora scoriae TaxID=643052 RepID=A0A841BI47_9ACTN|nr:hypothetical protein [Allocatelliglobosispora scoriae]MBB5866998.1 hypothetical protein [Allocatelliglobosispora scoriae]
MTTPLTPDFTPPPPPESPQPLSSSRARMILCGGIVAVAVLAFIAAVETGARDSALLFVGLPTVIALAVAAAKPARSLHGTVFKAITICLMLSAVWLHEGAICVVFAAPLV